MRHASILNVASMSGGRRIDVTCFDDPGINSRPG
jgi:hypothetical protein